MSRGQITVLWFLAGLAMSAGVLGCRLPGRPAAGDTPQRPDQVSDFLTLYNGNCAACHGINGQHGTAVSLGNPAYLAYAGIDNIAKVTAAGIPGSLMPAFAQSSGGLLTAAQVQILARGMVTQWGNAQMASSGVPPYQSQSEGDAQRGEQAYAKACLRCHAGGAGSLLDPSYLDLITDGGLRTIIVAGKPEEGMPNWTGYGGPPIEDGEIADLVAFIASHRTPGAAQTTQYKPDSAASQTAEPATGPKDTSR